MFCIFINYNGWYRSTLGTASIFILWRVEHYEQANLGSSCKLKLFVVSNLKHVYYASHTWHVIVSQHNEARQSMSNIILVLFFTVRATLYEVIFGRYRCHRLTQFSSLNFFRVLIPCFILTPRISNSSSPCPFFSPAFTRPVLPVLSRQMDYSSATHNLWQRVFSHLHGCSKRAGPDAAAHNRSIRLVCCDRSLANRQSCRTTVQQLNYRPIERKFTSSTWNVRHQKDLWNGAVSQMKNVLLSSVV